MFFCVFFFTPERMPLKGKCWEKRSYARDRKQRGKDGRWPGNGPTQPENDGEMEGGEECRNVFVRKRYPLDRVGAIRKKRPLALKKLPLVLLEVAARFG